MKNIIGRSSAMSSVYESIYKCAPSQAPVFLTGSSGTGKELVAQAIHNHSTRSSAPFFAINCAAIPVDLMESEVFGHVKGAFSGATTTREGLASLADGGTLFLDEITEMPLSLQAKLLRFVQAGTFNKVGSGKIEKVNVRFVSATNRKPLEAIKHQHLRADLYYRLNVISIDLPDLKDRGFDVVILARYFFSKFKVELFQNTAITGFSNCAEEMLMKYDWPGNVRQLENVIHCAIIMSNNSNITASDIGKALNINQDNDSIYLPEVEKNMASDIQYDSVLIDNQSQKKTTRDTIVPLRHVEQHAIEAAIKICNQNVVKAAGLLEVSPSTLYRKIKNWS